MFVKVRRAFTVCTILVLLGLFTLPSLYLQDRCAALNDLCDRVLRDVQAGAGDDARMVYGALREQYEAMRRRAELFLDHRVMDDASLPLEQMGVYLTQGDEVALAAAAAQFRLALDCILSIETGDLRLLL